MMQNASYQVERYGAQNCAEIKKTVIIMKKKFGKGMNIPEMKGDRKLVWGDCFGGDDFDRDLWNPWSFNASDIIEEMSDKTYFVENGELTLFCTKLPEEDRKDGKLYRSPNFLTTKNKMEFRYGYFEIKAMVPFYKGNSAAFWFCSSEKTATGTSAEVDMVELLGSENNVVSNLHTWPGALHASFDGKVPRDKRSHTFDRKPSELLRYEYHTYFMDWTPEYIDFGVDGEVYFHADLTDAGKANFNKDLDLDAFRLPIYFILSEYLYTPGRKLGWGLKGDEDMFTYVMKVDHVALYQKDGEDIYFK